jgi:hypothetical protein
MVLPIMNAMQSLQGLLTSLSGGLSSINTTVGQIGSAFSGVFSTLGETASNAFGGITDDISGVKDEVEDKLGSAFGFLKGKFDGIFNKKKVEEAIAPVKTAMEISQTGYADAIIRDKIQQEQLAATAAAAASKQQAADVAAIQSKGTVNVTVNAGGITDRTDKKQMALEIGNEIQRELARFNAGLTRAPRL